MKKIQENSFNFSKLPKNALTYIYDVLENDFIKEEENFDSIPDKISKIAFLDFLTAIELETERNKYNGDVPPEIIKRIEYNYNCNLQDIEKYYQEINNA